jgi:hypothetical protein
VAVKATAELKPFWTAVVKLIEAVLPTRVVTEVPLAVMVKAGAGTATAMACFTVWPPPCAVTVNV